MNDGNGDEVFIFTAQEWSRIRKGCEDRANAEWRSGYWTGIVMAILVNWIFMFVWGIVR